MANLHFNTAISQLMVFVNEANKVDALPYEYVEGFVNYLRQSRHILVKNYGKF